MHIYPYGKRRIQLPDHITLQAFVIGLATTIAVAYLLSLLVYYGLVYGGVGERLGVDLYKWAIGAYWVTLAGSFAVLPEPEGRNSRLLFAIVPLICAWTAYQFNPMFDAINGYLLFLGSLLASLSIVTVLEHR